MKQETDRQKISLRLRLVTTILVCWVVPILIVMTLAGLLLRANYERSMHQELETVAENAMRQLEMRVNAAFDASKAVSYDGIVRSAYRQYQQDGDRAALYGTVNDYISQNFSRDDKIKAVFISFLDVEVDAYTTSRGTEASYEMLRNYRANTESELMECMKDAETGIFLLESGGELYIVRNLLDIHFAPYATVVMLCDTQVLFQSLEAVQLISDVSLTIDGNIRLHADGEVEILEELPEASGDDVTSSFLLSGHEFCLAASIPDLNLWREMPGIKLSVVIATLLVLPLLLVMILLFHRHVTHPVEVLVEATARVQNGERGYNIEEVPRNMEFQKLYKHFNAMSSELESQFERSYKEQQALQQARIKALQSQINPHFLNNTLEIINWEARLANNERVSAMIEALSVMLDAALDRNGRGQIHLREELSYVDAYLYIIKERLGDRLVIEKAVDDALMEHLVPRLILQPLVENAVEHDISLRRGAKLCLRAYRTGETMRLEVEHDGKLTEEDRENIKWLLSDEGELYPKGQVGIRNVKERLRLMYGPECELSIEETGHGTVLARISFPANV